MESALRLFESCGAAPKSFRPRPAEAGPSLVFPDHHLNLKLQLALVERRLILKALERAPSNHSEAAPLLGISRNGLTMKMERLGMDSEG